VACVLAAVALAHGQGVRDVPSQRSPGPAGPGAVISGTVFSADEARAPVRHATVTVRNTELGVGESVTADAMGRFAVSHLPPGRFIVSAAKGGYLTMSYGARSPNGQPLVLVVGDGAHVTSVDIPLPRGAVISGRVLDETGQPAANVTVIAMTRSAANGHPVYRSVRTAGSDDRGEYRLYGLQPGPYLVAVFPGGNSLVRTQRATTDAEVAWALQAASQAPGSVRQPPPDPAPEIRFAEVYYPSAITREDAVPIEVGIGEERDGVDIALQLVPAIEVSGRVVRTDGRPLTSAQISLASAGQNAVQFRSGSTADVPFSFSNLQPGRYLITAGAPFSESQAAGGLSGSSASLDLWAKAEVIAAGSDITGLVLTLQPGVPVAGRLVFDSQTATEAPAPNRVRLTLRANADDGEGAPDVTTSVARVDANGTFTFQSVIPGPYTFSAAIVGEPRDSGHWMVKSATLHGRDVLDEPIDIDPSAGGDDMVVTFTDRVTHLSGTLTDSEGHPAPEYVVIAFPTSRTLWTPGSRRLPDPIRPATDGGFQIAGLPPGEYYLAALTMFDDADWRTPEFLEQVAAAAIRITLADGEQKRQDVRLAGK
jgi:hypothetical protein